MPLAPQVTIGDAVQDVLTRTGFAEQGTAVLAAKTRAISYLRQAAKEYYGKAEWSELRHEVRIPLIVGQDRYEVPDETQLGGLQKMEVESSTGELFPVEWGIRTHDVMPTPPTDTGYRVAVGQPDRVRIIGRELQILPAPTEAFVNLVVTHKKMLTPMTDEKESMPYESELLVQRATILMKIHFQKPGVQQALKDFDDYLKDRRAAQRGRRTFFVGGRKSHYVTRDKRVPRSGSGPSRGDGATFSDAWTPW